MSIIDTHVHLYPEELNSDPVAWAREHGETHWGVLCTRRRKRGQWVQGFPSVDELLHTMDAAGVERSVLQGWYWQHPRHCDWQNQFYAACIKAHPDRLSAFASFHPGLGVEASLELVRSAKAQGFVGLGELSPHSQGFDVADSVFTEVLELAAELRLPVNLHVTDAEAAHYEGRVETPLRDFLWLAREFHRTTFILAHWGGRLPMHEQTAEELMNLFYDTAASPLMYDEQIWKHFVEMVPVERILFGSDYPLNLYPKLDAQAGMTRLIDEARRQGMDLDQLAKNTKRLLHL